MLSKCNFMLVLIMAVGFSACGDKEEPYYGHGVTEIPLGNASFNGVFTFNGKEVTNYSARISLRDTLIEDSTFSCSFRMYKLREDQRFYETKSFSATMPFMDTATFFRDTSSVIPVPPGQSIPNMGLTLFDYDVLYCFWDHINSGWCYAEQRDSTSYFVDLRGLIVTEACGRPGGEEDTIAVEVKGVFTKRNK